MIRNLTIACSLLVMGVAGPCLSGQEAADSRPRIGYVLSGGGAKGMAHVGVLKVLEEVGLQPDYITGTSMGSIMGGLYSIGYTSDEISQLIETVDWDKVLTNEIPSDKVIVRRKHEYSRFLLELPVWDGKPGLPSGLIEGQKLSALFSELSWRQAGVNDFMEFPIPFTCIATDILQGDKVLLNSGDLSSAMRASMAIPSVFSAVERDSTHILVDGGVVRNFPVQEALDMGADKIIGVYVGFDSKMTPEQLRSLTSVITRTSLLSGAHDVESQMPLVDYLIVPDLTGYSPSSFSDGVAIMNRGEAAARNKIDELRAFADSVNALGPPQPAKAFPRNDSLLISEIRVLTDSESMERFVIRKSEIEVGAWLHPEELNKSIDILFGTLFFDKIEYYFETMDEGFRLVFRIKEKAPASIQAALHYDNTFGPGVILNFTRLNSLLDGSRLSFTADISEAPQFRAYYDFHFGAKRNFIGSLFINGEREKLPYFNEDNVDIGNYVNTIAYGGWGFRQSLGTNQQVSVDAYYRYAVLSPSRNLKAYWAVSEDPENQLLSWVKNILFTGPEASIRYQANTFDHNIYPTHGLKASLSYRRAFRTRQALNLSFPDSLDTEDYTSTEILDPYWHVNAAFERYFRLFPDVSLNAGVNLGLSAAGKPILDNYYIGGYRCNQRLIQVPFVGLHSHELLYANYLKGKLALQWEAVPRLFLSGLANLLFVSDDLNEFPGEILNWEDDHRYVGAGAGFTYRTPLGPVSVFLGSRTDVWNPVWYLNIGYSF